MIMARDSTSQAPYHPSRARPSDLPHVVRREPSSGTQGELLLELGDVHDQGELVQVARMYYKDTQNREQPPKVWNKQSMLY